MAVSVLIVDDHDLMRQSLKMYLDANDGIEVVGEAGDYESALAFVAEHATDVILLDLRLGDTDGMALARELRGRGVTSTLIGLSIHHDPDIRTRMIDAGVDDYVDKSADPSELVHAILKLTKRSQQQNT